MDRIRVASVIATCLLLASAVTGIVFVNNNNTNDDQVRIQIDQVDDDLYYIDYLTDYRLRDYMEVGGADVDGLFEFLAEYVCEGRNPRSETMDTGCSVFTINDQNGDSTLARNFDFNSVKTCVVRTSPSDGYSSISVTTLKMFGYDGQTLEEMRSNDYTFRGVAYIPMDGVNEKGLSVAINAVHNTDGLHQDAGKVAIFTTAIQRIILDYAATIEEAEYLISQFDLVHSGTTNFHLFLSDASGRSVAAEFKENDVAYTETDDMTNHYLDPEMAEGVDVTESSISRLMTLDERLEGREFMSYEMILDTIASVAQKDDPETHYTQWTCIYNMDDLTLRIFLMADYSKCYDFTFIGYVVHDVLCDTAPV